MAVTGFLSVKYVGMEPQRSQAVDPAVGDAEL